MVWIIILYRISFLISNIHNQCNTIQIKNHTIYKVLSITQMNVNVPNIKNVSWEKRILHWLESK